ncbi:lycopene cyclase domain-containing protein [Lutibacter oricola]|uniref:Lycopene cyclase domain-containing protein n=1 Tax=Lutibacter oricola TaxID=762486 RepID=A0A1H3A857_9FLAO|nr:lycopene cyclase domain-containing protein [Lutibacter oricola]SDX25755.1 lycopene cyclase domain-containing protein [Lutibacter oricola]
MKSLYLIINIASFIIPFLYSFEKKMNYIKYWKIVFLAIFITAIPFLIWDIYFTKMKVWGFNLDYYLGIEIFKLPLEEILFFFCIPYASIFTHYALFYFFPKLKLSKKITLVITILLLLISIFILIFVNFKWYTFIVFSVFASLLILSFFREENYLSQFYISFILILIPFFLVNGLLTGSFIANEVVWYNNDENLGFRLATIPIEDVFYAFSMLYPTLFLIEKFKTKFGYEK